MPHKHQEEVSTQFDPPKLSADDIVIDGLFGTGLNMPLSGGFAAVVQYINASPAKVVSIDIPSGMMGEDNTRNIRQNIIKANLTLTINLPKLSFLFAENEDLIGELEVLDIGINKEFSKQAESSNYIIEEKEVAEIVRPRKKFAHIRNGRCSSTVCQKLFEMWYRTTYSTYTCMQPPSFTGKRS